jgi:hypothetical protein
MSTDLWPIRLSIDEASALRWVEDVSGPDDVVIAGPILGSLAPGFSGTRSYLGHFFSTLDFDMKMDAVNNLAVQKILVGLGNNVSNLWVIDTPRERVALPMSIRSEHQNIYCRHNETKFGELTLVQYIPC